MSQVFKDEGLHSVKSGEYDNSMKSSVTTVQTYLLKFKTFGVKTTVLLDNANKYLVHKFKCMKSLGDNQYNISLETFIDGNVHTFRYNNIDFTECNLITSFIMDKFPDFPFCNFEMIHPLKREFNIIIRHKDAPKILNDTIDALISIFG